MHSETPARTDVARALNRIDPSWDRVWNEHLAHYSRHRALEIVATLLAGQEPAYAEVAVDESDDQAPTFEMVAMSADRIVRVVGPINNDDWPTGEVFPRKELRHLELYKTRLDTFSREEPLSESAAITLHFATLEITLPLSSEPMGHAAKALADHIPGLIASRMGDSAVATA